MRIYGWAVGILAFFTLIIVTGLCAVVSYSGVRSTVIQMWNQGLQVESPGQVLSALANPQAFPTQQSAGFDLGAVTPPTLQVAQTLPSPTPQAQEPAGLPADTPAPQLTPEVVNTPDPAAQYVWDDPRQIRILLLGIDERRGFTEERAYRTDTIILLNVDPVRKTAGLVSFPRDLWVSIPNFTQGRINTANYQGDIANYPGGGGPRLLMETISANFGVTVDRYVRVNFDVFLSVVDAIAPQGVEICITEPIVDDSYPDEGFGTITVRFDPGCQRLTTDRLLQYARTRKTQGSDFDRARRQQQVLDALRAQALSAGGITSFLGQIPALWQQLSDSYTTNLTLEEIIKLGYLMSEIPREQIQFKVIDENYVTFGKAPDGSDVLIPSTGRIASLIQGILYPQPELTQGDLLARSQAENVPIRVFNGTDIVGLAGRVQEWLIGKGVTVAAIGNAPDHRGAPTLIKDYGNGRWTAQYLADLLGLTPDRIVPGNDGLATSGVIVIAGPDIQGLLGQ
jgi:LCP family protein required for cell wall assembly